MTPNPTKNLTEEELETLEWLDSLEYVLKRNGPERVKELLKSLQVHAFNEGVRFPFTANTPYINTIDRHVQPAYPGDRNIERRIKSIIRWNAMAMVVRAQRNNSGLGGHISSYASSASLYEVGFNHFFKNKTEKYGGDLICFQGHASPGIYARAFIEGRLTAKQLDNFRRELGEGGGLSSYPHPRLMPDFWQFPTVSMGLGPITAIYQARFNRFLEDRGLKPRNAGNIWAFLGDGETDEPESLGSINMAAREKLGNLIFVVNCNLQRLDGPVRGNGKIIQELEGIFRGAGWNVIKVIWGNDWDFLLEGPHRDQLIKRMEEVVDGDYQKMSVESGAYIREHFFGKHPDLLDSVAHLSDDKIFKLRRGGHDPEKVYAAFKQAVDYMDGPSVILAKTIKGYGMGEAGEGKNITHQQKKMNESELLNFRNRFNIPISDEEMKDIPYYKLPEGSAEYNYIQRRRKSLGGFLPKREDKCPKLKLPEKKQFEEFKKGSLGRELSTTMAFVRILSKLLRDKELGKYVVPIIPDEARTFGMEALFRQVGIYSHVGQLYEPVDKDTLLYYKESRNGQIFEEGINEAGAMSTFIAAGTAYSSHGIPTIPFYIYYSMFGFQRIGDLAWLAGDIMCRGFMLGGTAGRTTLNGEGLQHQDGHSLVLASTIPNLMCYDPAFAYEISLIIQDGIRRMYLENEKIFYYLTLENENYVMPEMLKDAEEGILKGMYRLIKSSQKGPKTHLLAAGSIINSALEAKDILEKDFGVSTDVWSVTSFNELRKDGLACDRQNLLNPEKKPQIPYISKLLSKEEGVYIAASDYMKIIPDSISRWIPGEYMTLGTDGFGMSETREKLRQHFEIDANHISFCALTALIKDKKLKPDILKEAVKRLNIKGDKSDPANK